MILRNIAVGLFLLLEVVSAEKCVNILEWSTTNGQILVNGIPLVLKGVIYPGFETEYYAPLGLKYQKLSRILDSVKKCNFNAIQLPISLEMVRFNPYISNIGCEFNPDLCGITATRMLDNFIDRAAERGVLVALSNNQFVGNRSLLPPELWYDAQYSEELVINIWNALFARYRNHWNVFAIDLKNEPHAATWGNANKESDWNKAAERMLNKLSSFAGLFFVDGITWGNNLEDADKYPIRTRYESTNSRVIYTAHCYGPEVYTQQVLQAPDFPNNLGALYMTRFGFLSGKKLPVLIGEWASSNEPDGLDEKWNNYTIDWLRKNCLTNNFYWSLDRNASFTPGLFDVDWQTPNARKLEYINRLQPNPTKFEARDGKICITEGAFPESHCQHPFLEQPPPTDFRIAGERSIKSSKYGTYLSVVIRKDGSYGVVMVEGRSVRCEKWFIDEYPGKIDLRPHCSGKIWKYLNGDSDGNIDVVDWGLEGQLWTPSRNEDGSWCIRSAGGKYLQAKQNGQVSLEDNCDAGARFVLEAFFW